MKIAVLSDIHSNLIALDLVLDELSNQGIDEYIFLGDYISDGYQDHEVIHRIRNYADHAISGNRDKVITMDYGLDVGANKQPLQWTRNHLSEDSKQYLSQLADDEFVDYGEYRFLITHGDHPDILNHCMVLGHFDICFMGHMHYASDTTYQGRRFIHVGSLGVPSDGSQYKYLIVEVLEDIKIYFKQIDVSDTFDILSKRYQQSSYYKENIIWGTLILDSIQNGENRTAVVFDYLKEIMSINPDLTYGEAWCDAFRAYVSNYESVYKGTVHLIG